MSNPGFDAGSLRQRLLDAGLLNDFDDAVRTLEVARVLEILRAAKLPGDEAKRVAAAVLVNTSMIED